MIVVADEDAKSDVCLSRGAAIATACTSRAKKSGADSVAEWLEHLVPLEKFAIENRKTSVRDQRAGRAANLHPTKFARRATKLLREKTNISFSNCQPAAIRARRTFATATATVQRFNQIQTFDTANRFLSSAVLLKTDHDRGRRYLRETREATIPSTPDATRARWVDCRIRPRIELSVRLLLAARQICFSTSCRSRYLLSRKSASKSGLGFVLGKQKPQRFSACSNRPDAFKRGPRRNPMSSVKSAAALRSPRSTFSSPVASIL